MWKDKLDREITLGDWILYAVRHGDRAVLSIGKVVKITPEYFSVLGIGETWRGETRHSSHAGRLIHGERVVVINEAIVPERYKTII